MTVTLGQQIEYRDDFTRFFIDTEFYEDGETIDLISIGVVSSDGQEFYAVNRNAKLHLVSSWVRHHVLPSLPPYGDAAWMPREAIRDRLATFIPTDRNVELWAYYADYDWVALCQLYGTMMGLPNHFPKYCLDLKQLSYMLGNPRHPPQLAGEHNALADARWNRELFDFLRHYEARR
jgi:hypothetical protein